MPTPPDNPISMVHEAQAAARAARAKALAELAAGNTTIGAIIAEAEAGGTDHPFWSLTLYQLMVNQPEWSPSRAGRFVRRLRTVTGYPEKKSNWHVNVGWLIDKRSEGTRMAAFCELLTLSTRTAPTPRWPYD